MCVCEHLFLHQCECLSVHLCGERACVHKVPPCKCFNSVCGEQQPHPARHEQARKRPGPQTSGGPPGHGTPGEPPQGQPRPPPRKGRGEPEGGTSDSHSVGAPGCRGGKPAGSTGSRPHQGGPGPGPGDPKAPHPTIGAQQGQ